MFSIEKTIEVLKDPDAYAPHVRREAANRAIGILDKLVDGTTQPDNAPDTKGRAGD